MRLPAALFALLLAAWPAASLLERPREFRFAILGDRTGGANQPVYERVWQEIDAARPDFVVNVGDTIEGMNDRTAEAEWTELRRFFRRPYPIFFIPGNHDIWSEFSQRLYEKETGRPAQYSFDFENAHFTVLDNSRVEQWKAAQLAFLESDLAKHAHRSPKLVFFHKSFWLLPMKFQNLQNPFHQIVRKHKVDLVVSGHVHQFARLEREGVLYLMIGSSGGRLRGREFRDGWFYHHAIASVRGPQVDILIMETAPPFGQGRSFHAAEWSESGPLFDRETKPAP